MFRYVVVCVAMAVGLTGCFQFACTDEALFSTSLTVQDEQGQPVPDATLMFRSADRPDTACENFGGGEYACGVEDEGELTITIDAEGYESQEITVDVGADACHVISEQVTVTLTAESA